MSHDSHSKLQIADQHQQAYEQLAKTHQPVGLDNSANNKLNGSQKQEDAQTPFAKFSKDTNDTALSESRQWQQANLLIDSQRHLALLSGQRSQHTSTQGTHSHATDNTHHHSQTQMNQLVAGDIHYYSNKAQTHTAAHGDVTIQAHQSEMRLDSEQVLRIHSRDSIEIIASDTLTLKAAGSGIEISGGNVTFTTPSQVGYKASKVDWGSGGSESSSRVHLMQAEISDSSLYTTQFKLLNSDKKPQQGIKYVAFLEGREVISGITNASGETQQFQTKQPEEIAVHFVTELLSGVEVIRLGN